MEVLLEADMAGVRGGRYLETLRRRYVFGGSYGDFQNHRLRVGAPKRHHVERGSPVGGTRTARHVSLSFVNVA